MVKLKKYSMEDLKKSFGAMSELEQALYIGGGTSYIFDKMGHMTREENPYDYDLAICGSNQEFSYQINGELVVSSYPSPNSPNTMVTDIKGGDLDLFKFLADHTGVEWDATFKRNGEIPSGSTPCTIHTINSTDTASGIIELGVGNDAYVHSHPNRDSQPSSDDLNDMNSEGYFNQGIYIPGATNISWYYESYSK